MYTNELIKLLSCVSHNKPLYIEQIKSPEEETPVVSVREYADRIVIIDCESEPKE